ncbi:SURF1 family protein [Ramlibacter rhizophilus]|uniref:SURF1-like protein n=1 Tax=Ramlibacter rhizophilus TaxID=1781167 RepID=A0A4Z0BP70_9BURK|nr:SURF1 family protein [Ramlibacter rhizophilus]TFZ01107.1 SURF1 family protein [Ramlibacter rhizophilus]
MALLTARLGLWQWSRAGEKLALQEAIEARASAPAVDARELVGTGPPALLHRTAVLRGQWLAPHTVYLDNRQMQGRPGFYVVTPLQLADTDAVVLVQRGWVPRNFAERERLPEVATPAGEVTVRGRIAPPPSKLYDFAGAGQGPIRQNLDLADFRAETRLPLLEGSVQQTGPASEGLLRDWPVPASGAGKNYGYAFQWWALCAVILFMYVWFQFIAPGRAKRRD